jgi:hypothetical protein
MAAHRPRYRTARPATLIGSGLVAALLATPLPAAEPGCADPRARQFDFWVGDWDVYNREGGAIVGHSVVEPVLDDCVLQENWEGVSGSAGTSLNFFDPDRQAWRQLWVWREGTTLELEGRFEAGRMVLQGPGKGEDGQPNQNRITWFDNDNDTVRQLWEVSADAGKTWVVVFDGLYQPADARPADARPATPAPAPAP